MLGEMKITVYTVFGVHDGLEVSLELAKLVFVERIKAKERCLCPRRLTVMMSLLRSSIKNGASFTVGLEFSKNKFIFFSLNVSQKSF